MKMKRMKILTFAIMDYLVDMVTKYVDSPNAWKILIEAYKSRDLIMVLNLNYKLSTLKYQIFTSIEEFLKLVWKIKNQLAMLGEIVFPKILIQTILNDLLPFFNSLMYNFTSMD